MENTNKNVSQKTFDEVEQVIQDMVTSMRLLVKNYEPSFYTDPDVIDIRSGGAEPIVKTMYEKFLDVALAAQKEFYAQRSLRIADSIIDNESSFGLEKMKFLLGQIVDVDGQILEIHPDGITDFEFSLGVPTEKDEDGLRRKSGPEYLNLHFKFKENGARWIRP